jgi:hypothetical protein
LNIATNILLLLKIIVSTKYELCHTPLFFWGEKNFVSFEDCVITEGIIDAIGQLDSFKMKESSLWQHNKIYVSWIRKTIFH